MFRRILDNNKRNLTILYKLLHDLLLILIIFFMLALIAEGLLPGIITNHLSLSKIALAVMLSILAIHGIQKLSGISKTEQLTKKAAWPLLIVLALLIFNSLFRLNIVLGLFIAALAIVSTYFLAKTFMEK